MLFRHAAARRALLRADAAGPVPLRADARRALLRTVGPEPQWADAHPLPLRADAARLVLLRADATRPVPL